jgi:hypothetical protein
MAALDREAHADGAALSDLSAVSSQWRGERSDPRDGVRGIAVDRVSADLLRAMDA